MPNTQLQLDKIALGGSCHWCTEAIFLALKGVAQVEQGWVASIAPHDTFSEGVIVHFDPTQITLRNLIAAHLYSHSCTSNHAMRVKYRSAIYVYSAQQHAQAQQIIADFQPEFDNKIITRVQPFVAFTPSRDEIVNYYFKNPSKPFCQTYINPKLKRLMAQFPQVVDHAKLAHLQI